jgi:hypothetical protein
MTSSWLTWLQHPFVVFAVPLCVLLCGPAVYDLVAPPTSPRLIHEGQLQEIASLIDDIYSTFVNMTYLPDTVISRGPHQINATGVPCKRDHAVLRLMEIMPYVDFIELQERDEYPKVDWIYGGEFIDYRYPKQIVYSCDPIEADGLWYDTRPTTLPLTKLGDSGYPDTFVMLYDTKYNAVRVYDGYDFMSMHNEDMPQSEDYVDHTGVGLLNHSTRSNLAAVGEKDEMDWESWLHAPTLLRRILHAYQSLAWTPWQTNQRGKWGVDDTTMKALLRKNGWPNSFNPDQFNADLIRAKHAPSKYGPARSAHEVIADLEPSLGPDNQTSPGVIQRQKHRIQTLEAKLAAESDYQDRWALTFQLQSAHWSLSRSLAALSAARADVARLCPDNTCIPPDDVILWEFHSLEQDHAAAQRAPPIEKICEWELLDVYVFVPAPDERYEKCLTRRRREAAWLSLAYNQSKSEALARCAETGGSLISQVSLEDLVEEKIREFEKDIADEQARARVMHEWLPTLPEDAEKARGYFEMESSAVVNAPWYARERIEWMREQLGENEESRERLRRCFDEEGCI